MRIEDTDLKRMVPGAVDKIYETLKIFGLEWDEEYVQSKRVATGIYSQYANQLLEDGHAYYCFCPPESQEKIKQSQEKREIILRDKCRNIPFNEAKERVRRGEKAGIRLRIPEHEKISFVDFVLKKEISWETEHLDEVMLLKSDGFPTYHLGVVVDDAAMKISHIIRGRDWLPSTPIHLLLFKYLNFPLPEIGHLTDILDPAGGKLSKRKGSVSCEEFLAEGYLPEAILNFIMLLGWAPKDNREIFSLSDFVANFQKGQLQRANPVFNRKKLDWFNGYYLRQKSDKELLQLIKPFSPKKMTETLIKETIPLIKDRLVKLSDYPGLVDFLLEEPKIEINLFDDDKKLIKEQLTETLGELEKLKIWEAEELEKIFRDLATKNDWHIGHFFMAVRIAVTGKTATPPLFASLVLLGRQKTISRIEKADSALS